MEIQIYVNHTLSTFKLYFYLTETEYNYTSTTASVSYHTANAAAYNPTPPPDFSYKTHSIPGSIIPRSVIPSFAGLLFHNESLMTDPAQVASTIAETSMISEPTPPDSTSTNPATAITTTVNTMIPTNRNISTVICSNRNGYCYSHGYAPQYRIYPHSSANCKHKNRRHKENATKEKNRRKSAGVQMETLTSIRFKRRDNRTRFKNK